MSTPKRRWFRFSLRTFVIATVLCCWLAYELNWIRQRQVALATGNIEIEDRQVDEFNPFNDGPPSVVLAPGFLWLFGERGYPHLLLRCSQSDFEVTPAENAEAKRLQNLFPESSINFFWMPEPEPPSPPRPAKPPGSDFDGFKLTMISIAGQHHTL